MRFRRYRDRASKGRHSEFRSEVEEDGMNRSRNSVRKLQPVHATPLDEQLWLVNVALAVLAAFVVGTIVAYLEFDEPIWYFNGWVWLIGTIAFFLALVLILPRLDRRTIRRTVQLATILSLLFHLSLFVGVFDWKLLGMTTRQPKQRDAKRVQVTLPDYHSHHFIAPSQRPRQDYEKPLEVSTPNVERIETPTRQETETPPRPVEQQVEVTESNRPLTADISERAERSSAQPSAGIAPSLLSRQTTQARTRSGPPVDLPAEEAAARAPSSTSESIAARTELASRSPTTSLTEPAAAAASAVATNAATVTVPTPAPTAVRQTESSPQPATSPTSVQKIARADAALPPMRTATADSASLSAASAETRADPLRPQATAAEKLATNSPAARATSTEAPAATMKVESTVQRSPANSAKPSEDLLSPKDSLTAATPARQPATAITAATGERVAAAQVPSPPTDSAKGRPSPSADAIALSATEMATRRQTTAQSETSRAAGPITPVAAPMVATANLASASRQESKQEVPMVTPSAGMAGRTNLSTTANLVTKVADTTSNRGPQPTGEAIPIPAATAMARQPNASASAVKLEPSPESSTSPAATLVPATGPRVAVETASRLENPTGEIARAARSTRIAETAVTTRVPESNVPAATPSESASGAMQAGRVSMSRSNTGSSGTGRSENMDQLAPGAQSPARVASAAARRQESSQSTLPGPALAPSTAAAVQRSRAGADRPSSPFQAEDVSTPQVTGAQQPMPLTASSSASRIAANSNAPQGAVSASAGSVEVDSGTNRIVAEEGQGRVSGGGTPEPGALSNATTKSNLPTRASGQPSLSATQTADLPAAPAGSETGSSATALAAAATPPRTVAGGDRTVSAGANSGQLADVNVGAGTSPQPAELVLSRADTAAGGAGEGRRGGADRSRDPAVETGMRIARNATGGGPQTGPQVANTVVGAGATSDRSGSAANGSPALNQSGNQGSLDAEANIVVRRNVSDSTPSGSVNAPPAVELKGQPDSVVSGVSAANGSERASLDEAREAAVASSNMTGGVQRAGANSNSARSGPAVGTRVSTQVDGMGPGSPSEPAGTKSPPSLDAQKLSDQRGRSPNSLASGATSASSGSATDPSGGPIGDGQLETVALPNREAGDRAGTEASRIPANGQTGNAIPRARTATASAGRAADGVAAVGIPDASSGSGTAVEGSELNATGAALGRAASGGVVADVTVPEGPGGIGDIFVPRAGLDRKVVDTAGSELRMNDSRFVQRAGGGVPKLSSSAVVSAESYRGRVRVRKAGELGDEYDAAIERGLAYLARQQKSDGSWTLSNGSETSLLQSDTAATGLVVLAFQGANYNHRQDKYQDQVRMALDYLVRRQASNGDLFVPEDEESNKNVWLYSHSIAALALCEAYGMTQDPALREPAQRAVDFIAAAQNKDRGGWRYAPTVGTDLSVSGWMTMALESGKRAGLAVPDESYARIARLLDQSQASARERHLYRYNPWATNSPEQRQGLAASKSMTAVGLLMRLYSGWKPNHPDFVRGADYLAQFPPQLGTNSDLQRDTYYWYYATQVMLHRGGAIWDQWREHLFPLLRDSQVLEGEFAGSWDPLKPLPDRWARHAGRIYVTAMNLLSLEVKNRSFSLYEQ